MKKTILFTFIVACCFNSQAQKNKWVNLFDGKSTSNWHSWKEKDVKGWEVVNGELTTAGKNGDLLTNKQYENFILEFEFKASPKGNSGVLYKVIENAKDSTLFNTYATGPEYQIIDDKNYPSKITDFQKTGANYDIVAPSDLTIVKPAGEWNKGVLTIKNNKITHTLNGKIVAEYIYGNDTWAASVAKSKFAKWPYAKAHAKGHISLQGHGDTVHFKNIRIKEL
jgi:Domain of Unknown Function (DUF1080)